MHRFFLDRVKGVWVFAWFAAALAWYVVAFQLTGLWREFGRAQGGETPVWLDIEPFFSVETAIAAIDHIHLMNAETLAYAAYLVDAPFMALHAGALAALIGFALRQSGASGWRAGVLFLLPLTRLVGDLLENAMLAASIAMPAPSVVLIKIASVSGGLKAVAAVLSLAASLLLIMWTLGAKMIRKRGK